MSNVYGNDDGQLPDEKRKRFQALKRHKERAENLSFIFGDISIDDDHEEWMRHEEEMRAREREQSQCQQSFVRSGRMIE
jgi:hypothetical protein